MWSKRLLQFLKVAAFAFFFFFAVIVVITSLFVISMKMFLKNNWLYKGLITYVYWVCVKCLRSGTFYAKGSTIYAKSDHELPEYKLYIKVYAWYILCIRTKVSYCIVKSDTCMVHHVLDVYAILGIQAVLTLVSYAKRCLKHRNLIFNFWT